MAVLSLLHQQRLLVSPFVTYCHVASPPKHRVRPIRIPDSSSLTSSSSLQCAHFQSCSGCTHEFDINRPAVVDEASEFFKKHGVFDFTFESCKSWEWRCRAKLAVRGSSFEPLIGLYQEGTHIVTDIPFCKAHHPSINTAVELLRQGVKQLNIIPYDEDQMTGDLRYIQLAVTTYNTSIPASERYKKGKVQISLVWNARNENSLNSQKLNSLADFLWKNGGSRSSCHVIHSVWANFQTSTNNVIFGNRWRHILGEQDFWERLGGIDVYLAPSSFGQANTQAFDSLLRKLQKYVPFGASVADLYAGSGVIGASLATTRKCRSVKCIEVNKESQFSFEKTIERLPPGVNSSISWHNADASSDPLSWLKGSEVVVVDPPRKGLDESLIKALLSLKDMKLKALTSYDRCNFLLGSLLGKKILFWVFFRGSENGKNKKRPWILRAREAASQTGNQNSETKLALPQTLLYISCGWESFKEDCVTLLSTKEWHLEKAHGYNFFQRSVTAQ